ncbi:hypothetical protein SMY80_004266 [Cronobacter sakazakii]|nr:hypothetical protein [Cronobacter sakazakii]
MSTISTEQAKDLRNAFECWQQDYDPAEDKEQYDMFGLGVVAMDELLALRKERERAEPVAYRYRFHPTREAAGKWILVYTLEEANPLPKYEIQPLYTAPAATLVDDSLPYDPQIAEYEQMMEAEQAQADTTAQQFESLAGKAVVADENGNLSCPFCGGRCDPNGWMGSYDDGVPMCGPECEDCGATANSIEEWNRRSTALAGKAVVPEGWKLVPVEPTKEMIAKMRYHNGGYDKHIKNGYAAMLAVAPEPCK